MPLTRKLIALGHARAVTLPQNWLRDIEARMGQKLIYVNLEVTDRIVIFPVFQTCKPIKETQP